MLALHKDALNRLAMKASAPPAALAALLLALPAPDALALAPALLAQGKSHLAPGRQRGNPHPGRGRDKGKGWDDGRQAAPDWASWDRERWREYNRHPPLDIWREPVRIRPYAYRPHWANPNWIEDRSWSTGWYGGWRQPPWLWWPAQSSLWGVGALSTSSLINRAIAQALGWGQATIPVASTPWRLIYGSVEPMGYSGVSFVVSNGAGAFRMGADCRSGLLNGQVPSTVGQAQLLHTACQVAYGGSGL